MSNPPSDVDSTRTCSFVRILRDAANHKNEASDLHSEQGEIDDESKHTSDSCSIEPTATLRPPQITSTKERKEEACTDADCSPYEKLQNLSICESSAPPSLSCSSLDRYHDVVVDDIDIVELDTYLEDVQQATSIWNFTLQ
jgi:hypothetical protein